MLILVVIIPDSKNIMRPILFLILISLCISCQKDALVSAVPDVEGNWKFTGYKLSEQSALVTPCSEESKEVTLNISSSSEGYSITGTSFVNTYFSKVSFAMDNTKKAGKIEFDAIGTTKMAGSSTLMQCEANYYSSLKTTNNFILDGQKLYLYRDLTTNDSHTNIPVLVFDRN